jgi:hypothetical protein
MEYWAYENWQVHGHRATVHLGDCGSCNHGAGIHGGGTTQNGKWHGPFNSASDARAAVRRGGVEVRDCRRCVP